MEICFYLPSLFSEEQKGKRLTKMPVYPEVEPDSEDASHLKHVRIIGEDPCMGVCYKCRRIFACLSDGVHESVEKHRKCKRTPTKSGNPISFDDFEFDESFFTAERIRIEVLFALRLPRGLASRSYPIPCLPFDTLIEEHILRDAEEALSNNHPRDAGFAQTIDFSEWEKKISITKTPVTQRTAEKIKAEKKKRLAKLAHKKAQRARAIQKKADQAAQTTLTQRTSMMPPTPTPPVRARATAPRANAMLVTPSPTPATKVVKTPAEKRARKVTPQASATPRATPPPRRKPRPPPEPTITVGIWTPAPPQTPLQLQTQAGREARRQYQGLRKSRKSAAAAKARAAKEAKRQNSNV